MLQHGFDQDYIQSISSFSGADIVPTIQIPGKKPLVIGDLHTLTYSTHREVVQVRSLGKINPSGFARGPRTIGGTLIFSVFDRSLVRRFQEDLLEDYYKNHGQYIRSHPSKMLVDEMPPFNITVSMKNEHGQGGSFQVLGVVILNEGQVMSIDDIMTENTMQYLAHDMVPLKPYGWE